MRRQFHTLNRCKQMNGCIYLFGSNLWLDCTVNFTFSNILDSSRRHKRLHSLGVGCLTTDLQNDTTLHASAGVPGGRCYHHLLPRGTVSGWWRSKWRLSGEKCVRRLVDKQREVRRQTVPVGNGSEEPAEIRGRELRKRGKPQGGHQLGLLMKEARYEWKK